MTETPPSSLDDAIAAFDRSRFAEHAITAEQQRLEVVSRFPVPHWPEMTLAEYALGTPQSHQSFCYAVEFGSPLVGSIRGGSAMKHLIFQRSKDGSWFFPKGYRSPDEAWTTVRSAIVQLLDLVAASDFTGADTIAPLQGAQALRGKIAFVYHPDELLPIFSKADLDHFAALVGIGDTGAGAIATNHALRAAFAARSDGTGDWGPFEIERFLYTWRNPHPAPHDVYKVAPGEGAKYWDDCRDGGYVCVGWDNVGDLTQFESFEELRETFAAKYPMNGNQSSITQKARELWTLREMALGDVIVANRGTKSIVGIGEVIEPVYRWLDERPQFKNTVAVKWTDTQEHAITPVPAWFASTVAKLSRSKYASLLKQLDLADDVTETSSPLFERIAEAFDRKRQLILYGPPGTGKTYQALKFLEWWSSARAVHSQFVTFHPSYTYEDFVEGYRPTGGGGDGLRLELRNGIFKELSIAAAKEPDRAYVLVIDEMNRGNLPKIFGELITLLELDKRSSTAGTGVTVRLPQSGDEFSVPENVYIIGTMNTADRSIRLLDAAFRRRFAFIELMPDVDLLSGAQIEPLDLQLFLRELNDRVRSRHGREKQIGHAYLMPGGTPVSASTEFARIVRSEIVPLLQEYAFDDYTELSDYLGSEIVDVNEQSFVDTVLRDPDRLIPALARHLGSAAAGENG